jgi:hypothetical protein
MLNPDTVFGGMEIAMIVRLTGEYLHVDVSSIEF